MANTDLTMKAQKAIVDLTWEEKQKVLEILKAINGIEVSRACNILLFCREVAQSTAVTDTKNLFFDITLDESPGQKAVQNYVPRAGSGITCDISDPVTQESAAQRLRPGHKRKRSKQDGKQA